MPLYVLSQMRHQSSFPLLANFILQFLNRFVDFRVKYLKYLDAKQDRFSRQVKILLYSAVFLFPFTIFFLSIKASINPREGLKRIIY